jgi:aryl-alcohol dehydrogenase-like predicted oxidoreductase
MIEKAWETLARLKEEGMVRHIGVSNFSVEQLKRIMPIAPVSSLQPQYSMIYRNLEPDVLPFCLEHHIGVIAYSPMGAGLLTGTMTRERFENLPAGDWRRKSKHFLEPQLTRNLRIGERLKEMAARLGCSAGAIAIAWVLHNPAVTGAIVGGRHAAQVEDTIGGADLRLSASDLREIDDLLKE